MQKEVSGGYLHVWRNRTSFGIAGSMVHKSATSGLVGSAKVSEMIIW